jgi:hypothetical protein
MVTRLVMEPGSLIMERRMLLGIKERAERTTSPSGISVRPEPDIARGGPSSRG